MQGNPSVYYVGAICSKSLNSNPAKGLEGLRRRISLWVGPAEHISYVGVLASDYTAHQLQIRHMACLLSYKPLEPREGEPSLPNKY